MLDKSTRCITTCQKQFRPIKSIEIIILLVSQKKTDLGSTRPSEAADDWWAIVLETIKYNTSNQCL